MKILRLRIYGFRGIKKADIHLTDHVVLIGPNGCGKSTIIDALSLVLGRGRMVRPLTEHDFSGSTPDPTSRIRIIASLGGFSTEDPDDHPDWFRHGRAVPKWIDAQCREFAESGQERKLSANLGFCARFDHDELEIVSMRYFHDDDDLSDPFTEEGGLSPVPARLFADIGFFVLPSRREWDAVASFNSELFRRTVSNIAGLPAEEVISQRDSLRNPTTKVEDSSKLASLVDGLNGRLARLAPNAPKFQLRITAGDSESVLQALLPHYSLPGGPSLPAIRHGSGLVSLQSLLLLLEVGRARLEKGLSFILALEEPELHLSPGLQGRVVSEATTTSSQVICTTHSPEVARVFKSTNILILSNQDGQLAAPPFLECALASNATNNERKLFIQNRARVVSALMHPEVLVPEGRFDAEWLARFAGIADSMMAKTTPFSATFGIVPTENAAVAFTTGTLAKLRSHIVALVDGDPAGDCHLADLLLTAPAPSTILQLPQDWTIEDVVIWMLEPGGIPVLMTVQQVLSSFQISTLDQLRILLKTTNDRRTSRIGLKEDILAHEAIVGILDSIPVCQQRVVDFCEALVSGVTGVTHAKVTRQTISSSSTVVLRFQA